MNPYEVLGVSPNATDEEVKQAYRQLAKKYHPDNYVDNPLSDLAEEKMKEINNAYDTICEERRVASAPAAIAIEQSAAFSAGISFTPSPVMATLKPFFLSASTSFFFLCGVTRPNTVYRDTASSKPSSDRDDASTAFSAPNTPASAAIAETVPGSSPEIILTSTPCSLK